jgi:hypothetical protein
MARISTVHEFLAAVPESLSPVVERLRLIVDLALPEAAVGLHHGALTWSLGPNPGRGAVCSLAVGPGGVTFTLPRGRLVPDPSGRLIRKRQAGAVRLSTRDDVDADLFTAWLNQAAALETEALIANPA